jgi:hypothetical protein
MLNIKSLGETSDNLNFFLIEFIISDVFSSKFQNTLFGIYNNLSKKLSILDKKGNDIDFIVVDYKNLNDEVTFSNSISELLRKNIKKIIPKDFILPIFSKLTNSRTIVCGPFEHYGAKGIDFLNRLDKTTQVALSKADHSAKINYPERYNTNKNHTVETYFVVEKKENYETVTSWLSTKFKLDKSDKAELEASLYDGNFHDTAYALDSTSYYRTTESMIDLIMSDEKSMEAFFIEYEATMIHEFSHSRYKLGEYGAALAQKLSPDFGKFIDSLYIQKKYFSYKNVAFKFINHGIELYSSLNINKLEPIEEIMAKEIVDYLKMSISSLNYDFNKLTNGQIHRLIFNVFKDRSDFTYNGETPWNEYDDIVMKKHSFLDTKQFLPNKHLLSASTVNNIYNLLVNDRSYDLELVYKFMKKTAEKDIRNSYIDTNIQFYESPIDYFYNQHKEKELNSNTVSFR